MSYPKLVIKSKENDDEEIYTGNSLHRASCNMKT
jgi:hypothetical protein